MQLAPIVIFVYNRIIHTKQTLQALQRNLLASDSTIFIFSDAAKNSDAEKSVKEVRNYLKTIQGFKEVNIIEQEKNLGLASSIINGVTDVINRFGKVIVLEDDLITSTFFLEFMNSALNLYENEKKIWHISGWNYPIRFETNQDMYLYQIMNCWGWATWSDRWSHFEKNTDKLIESFTKYDRNRFNLNGYTDLWRQVKLNKTGRINTWAIYWYASIFQNHGFCLNPVKSFVRNIGHDGSGVHCNISGYIDNESLNNDSNLAFLTDINEDENILRQVKDYLKKSKKSIITRIYNKLKTVLLGYLK